MIKPRKVVLLGHTGFIGRSLEKVLRERGVEVVGLSWPDFDLLQPKQVPGLAEHAAPDAVLVFASALTPDKGRTAGTLADNVAMVGNVARVIEEKPFGNHIFFSSDAVYPMGDEPVTEESSAAPSDYYATAKFVGECILQAVAASKKLPLCIVRPTGIYGPGDTHNSYGPNRFARMIAKDGIVKIFGQGEETRDHLYVDDAARLLGGLIEAGAAGVYNLASGSSPSFGEIVERCRKISRKEFSVENLKRGGAGAITHRRYDISKLRKACPDFRFTDFDKGLQATLDFFAKEGA